MTLVVDMTDITIIRLVTDQLKVPDYSDYRICRNKRPPKTVSFQRGEYTKPMALDGWFFRGGGVHKTDGFGWVIFQRGEYTKPMGVDGWCFQRGEYTKPMGFDEWFFKGGSTQNRWVLMDDVFKGGSTQNRWVLMRFEVFCVASRIKLPGRLFRQIRYVCLYFCDVRVFFLSYRIH